MTSGESEELLRALFGEDWKPPPPGAASGVREKMEELRPKLLRESVKKMREKVQKSYKSLPPREQLLVVERLEERATASGVSGDEASLELRIVLGFTLGRLLERGTDPDAFIEYMRQILAIGS